MRVGDIYTCDGCGTKTMEVTMVEEFKDGNIEVTAYCTECETEETTYSHKHG